MGTIVSILWDFVSIYDDITKINGGICSISLVMKLWSNRDNYIFENAKSLIWWELLYEICVIQPISFQIET